MLFIALSSLQARSQISAYNDIILLSPDGIQLTPGNFPSLNFKNEIKAPYAKHHGFCWDKRKTNVYDENLKPINIDYNHSIHPPKENLNVNFEYWLENVGDYIFECMYPGYWLGSGDQIEKAINLGKRLAVDISHLHIIVNHNLISKFQLNKLLNYDKISEIHISQNNGKYDTHNLITKDAPFLNWVSSRKDLLWVYESYLHKLSLDERLEQIEIVRNLKK